MKQSFGKGIESLIPKKSGGQEKMQEKSEPIFYIEIEKVRPNPYQPRKNFDQEGLKALSDSVREYGIIQPLLVSRIEKEAGSNEYQLVAGERRLLAAKMVGLKQVPVIVRAPTEREKLEVSIIENVQRLDLNAMEKAEAYKRLQEEFNFYQKDIAKMVGKSREAVANTMRLMDLPEEARRALREERISEGHARTILSAENPEKQKILLAKIVKDGISVREAESFVQKLKVWQPATRNTLAFSHETRDWEEKIKGALGVRSVKLRFDGGKHKLTLIFSSGKEIEKFIGKFKT
jgi:ParB family transcriptional regulator, chromosome partitioning protein